MLRPILAVIELISYFVRPLSHSIRLGGNLMAGHAVIKVFAGFAPGIAQAVGLPLVGSGLAVVATDLLALALSVETFRGVAQLSGVAKSAAEKSQAERLARDTSGVTGVRNDIVVSP